VTTTAEFIAGFEGYAGRAYWDVNHWRVGYGSDTEGPEQNNVVEGMETTKPRALQNLMLRIPQYQHTAISAMGGEAVWEKLNENQQSAITSLVYNYGRLPIVVTPSDPEKTAAAIRALQGANGGVNRKRRLSEAAFYLASAAPIPAHPTPIPPVPVPKVPAPPLPTPGPSPGPPSPIPTSGAEAGWDAAFRDNIGGWRDLLIDERAKIDARIAFLDKMVGEFKTIGAPTPTIPQIPAAIPAAIVPQGIQTMLGKNWQTTLAGLVAALAGAAKVIPALQPYSDILTTIMGVAGGVGLMAAKDHNVTGGTIKQ
jgi:GH24 family phage-related lysozyme (muramidase)